MIKSEDYLNSLMLEYISKRDEYIELNKRQNELSKLIKDYFVKNNIKSRTINKKFLYIKDFSYYKYSERAKTLKDTQIIKSKMLKVSNIVLKNFKK